MGHQTQAIGAERASLKQKKRNLMYRQHIILRELNFSGPYSLDGRGKSRWDLEHELSWIKWELWFVERNLAVASNEAGSHFEKWNVPRGGQ